MTSLADQTWDVIVVGTGMGGGTIGRRLCEHGLSVLFVERGPNAPRAEEHGLNPNLWDRQARRVRAFWPDPMQATVDGTTTTFHPPIGAGVGGSSVFYAAALERPAPHDLDDSPHAPHPTGGWPVSYAQMRPYFEAAERMFHVCGTRDPLAPQDEDHSSVAAGPDIPPADQALFEKMRAAGVHPYQGHMALRYLKNCQQCLGTKCPKACKMDGRSAGVEPAVASGRAAVMDGCEVTEIVHDEGGVTALTARRGGTAFTLRARGYVLAAGALSTPRLLLASHELGNRSDLVGRNLMFHLNEVFALWPGRAHSASEASKAMAYRDLYHHAEGQRFGMVQAMGIAARYGEIVHFINMAFDRSVLRHLPFLRQLTRLPAALAVKIFGNAKLFVGLLEDFPYRENRVTFDAQAPDRLAITYTIAPELRRRRKAFRRALRKSLPGLRMMLIGTGPELNFGHPCGTARFGSDPETSVLDAQCRVHDVDNLWVADASFMPSSMGVNPSLTIAANALRVGDAIAQHLQKESARD